MAMVSSPSMQQMTSSRDGRHVDPPGAQLVAAARGPDVGAEPDAVRLEDVGVAAGDQGHDNPPKLDNLLVFLRQANCLSLVKIRPVKMGT